MSCLRVRAFFVQDLPVPIPKQIWEYSAAPFPRAHVSTERNPASVRQRYSVRGRGEVGMIIGNQSPEGFEKWSGGVFYFLTLRRQAWHLTRTSSLTSWSKSPARGGWRPAPCSGSTGYIAMIRL